MRTAISLSISAALALCTAACGPSLLQGQVAAPFNGGPRSSARPEAPRLRKLSNGHYRVRKPWTVQLNGRTYRIQKGYISNGITAPDSIKFALGDGVEHPETWAAMFHDWLFTQPGMSRAKADKLFYDLLLAYGVSQTKARLMYTSVSAYSARKQGN